jgi:hypothetical protein
MNSCQNGSVERIGATRLVLLQQIPLVENRFDENFKAALELLYPHECHDTVYIQDRIFLERIDLKTPFKREFIIPPSLLRDFFGSNNPDKKRALREELFYFSDTSFEKSPDKQFLTDPEVDRIDHAKAIGDYISGIRKNDVVYLISNDTLYKKFETGGIIREVHNDFAKLNCRIVADLRKKSKEDLVNASVILIVIPPEITDPVSNYSLQEKRALPAGHQASAGHKNGKTSAGASGNERRQGIFTGSGSQCPPDSMIVSINKQRHSVIMEFRNLLHYIATTRRDDTLKNTYRKGAFNEIHKIPEVKIEGLPDNGLDEFLHSDFSGNLIVSPVRDQCEVIIGVRINVQ